MRDSLRKIHYSFLNIIILVFSCSSLTKNAHIEWLLYIHSIYLIRLRKEKIISPGLLDLQTCDVSIHLKFKLKENH